MLLPDYLAENDESEASFAERAGVARSTINDICRKGAIPRADISLKIVTASDGEVTLADLAGEPDRRTG